MALSSFEAEQPVDALREEQDERLPGDQPADPVQELAVEDVWPVPAEDTLRNCLASHM